MAQWSIPFDVLAKKIEKRMEDVVVMSTIYVFWRVILRSPVDTGRFRANWVCTKNYIAEGYTREKTDKSGSSTVDVMVANVTRFGIGGIVYLTNSLPYAMALEYGGYPNPPKRGSWKRGEDGYAIHVSGGYSMQAPNGMVRITAREFDAAVRERIRSLS